MIVQKIWGEENIVVNDSYCGKRMTLNEDGCCSLHKHEIKDETFLVESGEMLLEVVNNDTRQHEFVILKSGSSYRINPNILHRFYGIKKTVFYEFSTHDDASDSIRETSSQIGMPEDMRELYNRS